MKEILSSLISENFVESFSLWAKELPTAGVVFISFLGLIGIIPVIVVLRKFIFLIITPTTQISLLEEEKIVEVKGKVKSYDGDYLKEPFTNKKVLFYYLEAGIRKPIRRKNRKVWRYIPFEKKALGNQRIIRLHDGSGEAILANYTFSNPLLGVTKKKLFRRKIPANLHQIFPDLKSKSIEEKTLRSKYYFRLHYLEVDTPVFLIARANRLKIQDKPTYVLSGGSGSLSDFKMAVEHRADELLTNELRTDTIKEAFSKDFKDNRSDSRFEIHEGGQFKQVLVNLIQLLVSGFFFCLFTVPFILVIYFRFLVG